MVRRKKKEQTSLWAQLLILFTVISFRRSKLRSVAAVVSSSRRRRNGAVAVGPTVWRRLRQAPAEPASAVPGRKAHKSQRGPVQASIGVVRCNVRGAATANALLVIEDKREARSLHRARCTAQEAAAVLRITQYAANQRAVHRLL